jgi:hypothetical protein
MSYCYPLNFKDPLHNPLDHRPKGIMQRFLSVREVGLRLAMAKDIRQRQLNLQSSKPTPGKKLIPVR